MDRETERERDRRTDRQIERCVCVYGGGEENGSCEE